MYVTIRNKELIYLPTRKLFCVWSTHLEELSKLFAYIFMYTLTFIYVLIYFVSIFIA